MACHIGAMHGTTSAVLTILHLVPEHGLVRTQDIHVRMRTGTMLAAAVVAAVAVSHQRRVQHCRVGVAATAVSRCLMVAQPQRACSTASAGSVNQFYITWRASRCVLSSAALAPGRTQHKPTSTPTTRCERRMPLPGSCFSDMDAIGHPSRGIWVSFAREPPKFGAVE
jgi:hypothetical protein